MAKKCDDSFLTSRGGTAQAERLLAMLLPDSFEVQDLSVENWMQLAHNFAEHIRFFGVDSYEIPVSNWLRFFQSGDLHVLKKFISEGERNHNVTPHLTLFITFLKLMELSRERFNNLTERHLDYYYSEVLQIAKNEAREDQVHLLFELAKNAPPVQVASGTQTDAGKDVLGKKRIYQTDGDVVVNDAQVASIKSIYHDQVLNKIKVAHHVNSLDGLGAPLKENTSWWPFGYPVTYDNRPPLANAKLGVAFAAPILKMAEGDRKIRLRCTLDAARSIPSDVLVNTIQMFITSEKDWIGPLSPINDMEGPFRTQTISTGTPPAIQFSFSLTQDLPAIVPFDAEVHSGNFATSLPVLKLVIDTTSAAGYDLSQQLAGIKLRNIAIDVQVVGVTQLQMSNDLGDINAKKPFYPFTPRPFKNASLEIGSEEIFSKRWTSASLNLKWLNLPENLAKHYEVYCNAPDGCAKALADITNKLVLNADHFTTHISLKNKNTTPLKGIGASPGTYPLFDEEDPDDRKRINLLSDEELGAEPNSGPLKLSLNNSFYHELFPRLYALAFRDTTATAAVPREPYTPFLESLTVDYTATQTLNYDSGQASDGVEKIEVFHILPFGEKKSDTLFPGIDPGGSLHIGLSNARPNQNINLLFQLLEGTENTGKESFLPGEKISWSYLSGDVWEPLAKSSIIQDSTDNFLKTGIITFVLPASVTDRHTLMPTGNIWLKAHTERDFDVVCRFLNIHAQAQIATFSNRENDLAHLQNGLPAETISKLIPRNSAIKKVLQPYASFGGSPEETQEKYYRRVSERLRHKDRALTLWDYEHLVLQHFPKIYKVKCLNHTCCDHFSSPGKVTVVVVPNIIDQNVFDPFEPRVSQAKLNEITRFLDERTSYFVKPKVINPEYEKVQVSLKAKFKSGLDEQFYLNKLQEDIKKYLSPWAYEETAGIIFGISLHKSMLIKYLEELDYVDYLTDVTLKHQDTYKAKVVPSNPKAILVAAKTHVINLHISTCAPASTSSISEPC